MSIKGLLKRLPLGWLLTVATVTFRIREVTTNEQKMVFRDLWTKVWLEESYAHQDQTLSQIEKHYTIFDHYATDLLLYFLAWPIGTMRLIWDNQKVGMPVLNDFEITSIIQHPVVELTLLALKPKWRGLSHLPSLVLWREGYRRATTHGMAEMVMAADWRLFHLLRRIFPFRQIGPEKFYEGSNTIPAALNLEVAYQTLAQKNPQLLRFFVPA
jgi:hypothetical protein